MKLEPVIGLEIHVQLKTATKMFCGCENVSDERAPNTAICPVCTGHPGTLPVTNAKALELGVLAALAINCRIPDRAKFDRKNYFYPDLPKGYQISQFDEPVSVEGYLDIELPAGAAGRKAPRIGITRLHLEEDAAKLVHSADGKSSYVDYNRGGTPLAEIVTEPDFASPAEARVFLQELQRIMRAIGASDADMEKGQMRCDANISMREVVEDPEKEPRRARQLNPKTEVKNLNSIRNVERALEYEIKRQTGVWEETGNPVQETTTRGWDDAKGETTEQRSKEAAHDYRYFPEPDIPPLDLILLREKMAELLPELPQAKRARFMDEYGLTREDATLMTDDPALADYVEETFSELRAWLLSAEDVEGTVDEKWEANKRKLSKLVSGWLLSKLGGLLVERKMSWPQLEAKITPDAFSEFLTLIHESKVNSATAQVILAEMLETGASPESILKNKDLAQKSSPDELKPIVEGVINQNPDSVAQYRSGKIQVVKFLLGAVMKATGGKANPQVAEELLKELMK
jgi:aspartyl-tRNA(Asn)/glutamyl-tRNA(Gln) amidotransferase subunit B